MASTDINASTTTALKYGVPDYSPNTAIIDEPGAGKEYRWINDRWAEYLGYFKNIPEFRRAIIAMSIWTVGKGYVLANTKDKVRTDMIRGWGEDTFSSILMNMIQTKMVNGDAFSEVIRKNPEDPSSPLINLKPLNPGRVGIVVTPKGIIKGYDMLDHKGQAYNRLPPDRVFHLSHMRCANEIHGTSVLEACKWVIDAKAEAMADLRRGLHTTSVRVLYVDFDDSATLSTIKTQYKEAIKNGEVMIIPAKPQDVEFRDLQPPVVQDILQWIRYLDNLFYEVVGVPKIITGGSQEFTEASSKVGMLTFEQPYMTEQAQLEADIKAQLNMEIKFARPRGIGDTIVESEAANTGQLNFQPNEQQVGLQRSE